MVWYRFNIMVYIVVYWYILGLYCGILVYIWRVIMVLWYCGIMLPALAPAALGGSLVCCHVLVRGY
jgi:hypothetical protein